MRAALRSSRLAKGVTPQSGIDSTSTRSRRPCAKPIARSSKAANCSRYSSTPRPRYWLLTPISRLTRSYSASGWTASIAASSSSVVQPVWAMMCGSAIGMPSARSAASELYGPATGFRHAFADGVGIAEGEVAQFGRFADWRSQEGFSHRSSARHPREGGDPVTLPVATREHKSGRRRILKSLGPRLRGDDEHENHAAADRDFALIGTTLATASARRASTRSMRANTSRITSASGSRVTRKWLR